MTRPRLAFVLALALISACASSPASELGGDGDGDDERELLPLCASCTEDLGGETGDLSPPMPAVCEYVREPIDLDDTSLGFAPREILAYVEGEHEIPMRWQEEPYAEHERATGFDEETMLQLEIRNAEVSRVRATPTEESTPEAYCEDYLEIDVDVTLATADGAIAGEMENVTIHTPTHHYAYGHAVRPLTNFSGTLDLHPDEARPHGGSLSLRLWLREGSVRGALTPSLWYADESDSEGMPLRTSTVEAQWPADECPPSSLPLSGDDLLPGIADRTLDDLIDGARARMDAANPIASTDLDIDIEIGDVFNACLVESVPPGGTIVAKSTARIATSDERLMLDEEVSFELMFTSLGVLANVAVAFESEIVPAADFEETCGYADVDFGTWECGQLRLIAFYGEPTGSDETPDAETAAFVGGQLEVDGTSCPGEPLAGAAREHTAWCTASPCPISTNPYW